MMRASIQISGECTGFGRLFGCLQAQREAQALLRNKMEERGARQAEERAASGAVQSLQNDLVNLQRQAGVCCKMRLCST